MIELELRGEIATKGETSSRASVFASYFCLVSSRID